jgi:hypothetical protein
MASNELTYIEVEDIKETPAASVFERCEIQSKFLTVTAWYLSHFGKLSPDIWWGYQFGYYALCLLPIVALTFSIDVLAMVIKGAVIVAKAIALKAIDLAFMAAGKVAGVLGIAFALFLIVMFCYNEGWEGCKECYKNIVEWLGNVLK